MILENDVHRPLAPGAVQNSVDQLVDDVPRTIVIDGVHGIEAQAVEVIFLDPVARVVYEELAHVRVGEIDRIAPRRAMPRGEEFARITAQIIALRPEMVVDDIEQDREIARVSTL